MPSAPTQHEAPPRTRFRLAIAAFGAALGVLAAWMLAAELVRRSVDATSADFVGRRSAACGAARLGLVRGDLWSDCALADANPFARDGGVENADASAAQRARTALERALALAPHDARAWLALASLGSRFDWISRRATAALRMSYYTGPNETALIPLRLATFARLDTSADKDLQEFAQRELAAVVNHKPELKWSIVAAYRDALPAGKNFFDAALRDLDPKLLAGIRS